MCEKLRQKFGLLVWGLASKISKVALSAIITHSPINISGTPKDSALKFLGLVDAVNVFKRKCSKLGVTPKFGPQGGSNFHIGPIWWAL